MAGEALFKFSTSNTNLQFSVIGILYPFAKVRILLSSSTVFKFSIQMASTGPSHVIQVVNLLDLLFDFYQIVLKTPGIQSSAISDLTPYIS